MQINVVDGVIWYAVFVGSTVCHEAAHAWSALKLGDDTAARGGQVSLNPVPHVRREPIGMVVVPIVTWLSAGWLMGWASAPFNVEWARKFPKRTALMAIAGPAANLLLVIAAAWLIRIGMEWHVFTTPFSISMSHVVSAVDEGFFDLAAKVLSVVFSLNLLLFVFNLLPIPPLDGSSLPLLVLPEKPAQKYFDAMRSPVLQIVGFIIIAQGIGSAFQPVLRFAISLLHPSSE